MSTQDIGKKTRKKTLQIVRGKTLWTLSYRIFIDEFQDPKFNSRKPSEINWQYLQNLPKQVFLSTTSIAQWVCNNSMTVQMWSRIGSPSLPISLISLEIDLTYHDPFPWAWNKLSWFWESDCHRKVRIDLSTTIYSPHVQGRLGLF